MEVHHIGYLVRNLEDAVEEFQKLGYQIEREVSSDPVSPENLFDKEFFSREELKPLITQDLIRKVNIVFMVRGGYRVELVEPTGKESTVYGLLKRYANSPYHICYCSDNLTEDMETLQNDGWTMISRPEIAPAISDHLVVFFMNASIGMIELVAK